jgi:hypothetical protein
MLVPLGDPRSLQHPYRALGETALAWPRNLAIILLNDAQPRTITNATDFSHILSLSSGPAFYVQPDECHYNSIAAPFDLSLYI